MKTLSTAQSNALAARSVRQRDFVWITAKDRTTGAPQTLGLHNDVGTLSVTIQSVTTGTNISRTYIGAGALLSIDDVPLTADLGVRELRVTLSQIDANVANLFRGYEPRLAPIEIHRGIFDPVTQAPITPALPYFIGLIDKVNFKDPVDGQDGSIEVTAVSQLREVTRANPDTRSDESQRNRSSTDRFFRYAGVVGNWSLSWGTKGGKINHKPHKKKKFAS